MDYLEDEAGVLTLKRYVALLHAATTSITAPLLHWHRLVDIDLIGAHLARPRDHPHSLSFLIFPAKILQILNLVLQQKKCQAPHSGSYRMDGGDQPWSRGFQHE